MPTSRRFRLVDAGRAHPVAPLVLAHRQVPVGQPADPVDALDRAQLLLGHDLVQRERRGQQAQRVQPVPGLVEALGQLVALPQLRLEVMLEAVVDHQPRGRQRGDAIDDVVDPGVEIARVGDRVVPALGRHEVAGVARHHQHAQVGETAHHQRILVAQHVVGQLRRRVDDGHVGAALTAPERLRLVGVDEVEHDLGVDGVLVVHPAVAAAQPLVAQPRPELRQRGVVATRPPVADLGGHAVTSARSSSFTSSISFSPSISTTHASRSTS